MKLHCWLIVLFISATPTRSMGWMSLNNQHVITMQDASQNKPERKFIVKDGRKQLDRTGIRYGRLVAKQLSHFNARQQAYWECVCDCGNTHVCFGGNLTSGQSKSCGCYAKENPSHLIHGHSPNGKQSKEYITWVSMRSRVKNPNNKRYHFYGGRGIKVCARWDKFENFLDDMGPRPLKHSIHRVDNNGDYSPENCIWTTATVQARAKTNTRWVSYRGEIMCLADVADEIGMPYSRLHARLRLGMSLAKALANPVNTSQQRFRQ